MKRLAWLLWLLFASPAIAGQATLSWDPPTTNTDGTPLNDLGGYKTYYGTSSGNYGSVIDVGNVLTYTVSDLSNGTYYFTVTAYDTSGNESAYSNEVSKTVASAPIPAPVALQAVGGGGTVTLSWDKPNHTDIAGYQISRGLNAGLYNTFYDIGAAQTAIASCVVSYTGCVRKQHIWYNTPPGTYYFTVRGYDSQGAPGAYASEASVTLSTDAVLPADVTNFTATKLADTSIRLTWTNPSNPDFSGVKIEYAFNSTTNYILLASLKGYPEAQQAYNHYNLIPGAYNYRIHTYDTSGNMTSTEHASTTLAGKVASEITAEPESAPAIQPAPQKREKSSQGFGCGTITNTKPPDDKGGPDASVLALATILLFLTLQKNKRERKMKLITLVIVISVLFANTAIAASNTLIWEQELIGAEDSPIGYKIEHVIYVDHNNRHYVGEVGSAGEPCIVMKQPCEVKKITIYGLEKGSHQFFVTALGGTESDRSNIITRKSNDEDEANLTADISNGQIHLSWTNPSSTIQVEIVRVSVDKATRNTDYSAFVIKANESQQHYSITPEEIGGCHDIKLLFKNTKLQTIGISFIEIPEK